MLLKFKATNFKKRPNHCWISESIRKIGIQDFTHIKIRSIPKKAVIKAREVIVEVYDINEVSNRIL